jgi:hypothetical protein
MLHGIMTGVGLSAASGLNAYGPLFILGALARWTDLVKLGPSYEFLSRPEALAVLAILGLLDFIGDKVPMADHALHAIGMVIHPIAGAVSSLAATSGAGEVNPALAGICGLVLAGGGHLGRTAIRPVVTVGTAGLGNPVVSLIEDVIALTLALLAVLAPIVALLMLVAMTVAAVSFGRRVKRRVQRWRHRRRLRPPPLPPLPPPLPGHRR